ncbi:MAG: YfhO family protein, partial [Oscillospiraceae bacterium]
VMTTVYSYNNLHWVSNNNKQIAQDFYHNSAHLGIEDDEYYRIDTLDTYMNLGIVSNTSSVNFFTTTISGSIFDFYNGALETSRTIKSNVPHNNFQLRSLLSCKYYIVSQSEDVPPHAVLISENGNFKIYQNEYFIPMGYCMKNVITQSEYSKIDKVDKPNALLNAIVLSDDDVEKFGISAVSAEEVISGSLDDTIEQNVNFNKNNSCKSFEKVKNGYRAVSDFENERIIFFSIPADKGWTVRVNGKKTSALIADYGLMAVKCQGGNNIIEFAYMPVGLKIGGLMSAVSAMLMAVYFFVSQKHYK